MTGSVSKKTELNSRFYSPFHKGTECCEVMSLTLDNKKLLMLLSNTSVHTVYGLQVHITDYQSRADLIAERPVVENAMGFLKVFNPSTYLSPSGSLIKTPRLHGCFVQHQEFSHIGGHQWVFAEKVVNSATDKVLYHQFPARFTNKSR